jgi:hypothetical protein
MKARILVLGILLVLVAASVAACSLGGAAPTATPKIVEVTKVVEKPVTQIVEKQVTVVVQATAVPQATAAAPVTAAPQATAAPKPVAPTFELTIMPIPANPANPNAITGTLTYVTSTAAGPAKTTAAMGQTGLDNISVGIPVSFQGIDKDAKNPTKKWAWALTSPKGSKATLAFTNTVTTKFTPDIPGMYRVTLVASNDAGSAEMQGVQVHANTYVGADAGTCKTCHPNQASNWAKTGHATAFSSQVTGGADPATTHFNETCIRCHTTGWAIDQSGKAIANKGFADVQAKTGWTFPTYAEMAAKNTQIWDAVPADLKNVSNVQCEDCHGPAGDHVANHVPTMAASIDEGTCDVCHNASSMHTKGTELQNAGHTNASSPAFGVEGPAEQACVRCHSGEGYITFVANPTNPAAWNTEGHTIVCATCHDPHGNGNAHQLRVVGKPFQTPTDLPDMGLSATCAECHNGRTSAAQAAAGSFPHYSAAAEMVYNQGGYDYGLTLPNSPHGQMVGAAPVPDPADKTGKTTLFGGATPGACVTCHMWPTITDPKDPNYLKVGAHSFNTVSPDGKFDYGAACASCHGEVKDFNLKSKADYDGNGKVEGVQDEVKGLLNLLLAEFDKAGIKKQDAYPYFTNTATMTAKQKNAMYNFREVYGVMWTGEGKASAIHNFKRSVALLQASYKDLTGNDVPGATIMK